MAKNKIRVSVVVPIYMVEKYVRTCIESILSQTYKNLEVILVDDGSKDDCAKICDEYAIMDKRIRVIHKENGGLVSARKVGVRVATGDYVLYVDGDDWIDFEYVEKMLEPIIHERLDMVTTIAVYMNYDDGRQLERITSMVTGCFKGSDIVQKIYPKYIYEDRFYDTSIPTNAYLYLFKREFLLGIQEEIDDYISMGEDMALTFRCLLKVNSLAVVNVIGYHYRQRLDSMIHRKHDDYFLRINMLYNNLKKAIVDAGESDRTKKMERKIAIGIFFELLVGAPKKMMSISDEYVFPFSKVKKGSKIFIYGMGAVGMGMIEELLTSDDYILVGCSDQGWMVNKDGISFNNGKECKVYSPEKITDCDFDYLIIGISRFGIRKKIAEKLVRYGISENKIVQFDHSKLVEKNLPF